MKQLQLTVVLCFLCSFASKAQETATNLLTAELQREFSILTEQTPSVYYMDYSIKKKTTWGIFSQFGNLITSTKSTEANIVPTLRVGDNEFDNTHTIKGKSNRVKLFYASIPADFEEDACRQSIWNITNEAYNEAVNEFRNKKNNIKVDDEVHVADFSTETARKDIEPLDETTVTEKQKAYFEKLTAEASALFLQDKDMMAGNVIFRFTKMRKYFVSSEGHEIAQNYSQAEVIISGGIRSSEGNQISLGKTFNAFVPNGLVAREEVLSATQAVVEKLIELKNAPIAEPYTGPAILSPAAASVFFHEIFGHRVEGHRFRDLTNGNTFKDKLGEQVLPKSMSIVFDPQVKNYKDFSLNGYYKYDDQGVEGEKVTVVEKGILKSFLMNRTPIEAFSKSNGHGRNDQVRQTVSRQSNMFIKTDSPQSEEKMRKSLIKICKKQDLDFGYYFKTVTGGFTQTSRFSLNAFNVTPTEVYKIYVDGREDELVRGVNMIGTPLSMFSTIMSAGDTDGLFNGYCGAESGSIPVACISPSLLVGTIETQKKPQSYSTGPILPAPSLSENNEMTDK